MDTSVICNLALGARLKKFRFSKINAEIFHENGKGGRVRIEVQSTLKGDTDASEEILCELTVEAIGFSKEDEVEKNPRFRVSITTQGFYQLATAATMEQLRSNEFTQLLSKPLTIVTVNAVQGVLRQIGITGVQIPLEPAHEPGVVVIGPHERADSKRSVEGPKLKQSAPKKRSRSASPI